MSFSVRASGGYWLYSSASAGVTLAADSGSWSSFSDRNAKEHFCPVDPQAALAGVMALPISRWSYKTEPGVRHLGPIAQDFHAAFGVGENDTTIPGSQLHYLQFRSKAFKIDYEFPTSFPVGRIRPHWESTV